MEEKECLSDERLVRLHQRKRLNAFFTIYNRHRNYGYAIIYNTLVKYKLINALKDEKDAILYDSIMEAISTFNKTRGTFRKYLSAIIGNQTITYIREFQKDPLSDYISLDASIEEGNNLRFMDSMTFANKSETPKDNINLIDSTKKVIKNYNGAYKRRAKQMIQLKECGYSFEEIAKKYKISEKAVRSIFYRIKKNVAISDSKQIKK